MKKSMIALALLLVALPVFGQTTPFVYPKFVGDTVTFAWDHTPFQLACGTVLTDIPRGSAVNWTCEGRSYPVTWNAAGDTVTVGGYNADGSDYVAVLSYRWRGFKIGPPETAGPAGDVVGNQKSLPLDFGVCDLRLEVQAVRTVGTSEAVSSWAKSTDPAYATVDNAARGWIVRVETPPPPPPPAPGSVTRMRVIR